MFVACSAIDWIQAAAVVCGVWIGYRGLLTWREQLRGNVRHDSALSLLERAYLVRDALQSIRRACTFAGPLVGCDLDEARAACERFNEEVSEPRTALDVARVRAEAVFGVEQVGTLLRPLHKISGKIRVGVDHEILRRSKSEASHPPRVEGICWVSDDPDRDEWTAGILAALRPLEEWARSELR